LFLNTLMNNIIVRISVGTEGCCDLCLALSVIYSDLYQSVRDIFVGAKLHELWSKLDI